VVVSRLRQGRPAGLVAATVAGAVTRADQRELVTFVQKAVARFGIVKVLIRLERYTGPHHDGRFDPDGLWGGGDADGISKIAIVGEPAWKTISPATVRQRRAPIKYFATEQAARCWLANGQAHDVAPVVSATHAARNPPFRGDVS